ncbi:MAG: amidohydrolase family protein [Gammaproteobacteria bacterium]|nr:amidohydrolase family protein [Gammaproteobacteria bacterium]
MLGRYVREKGTLSLQDAIGKMTYLPAKMLHDYSPSMAKKGRIKIGADADITVFDPATVIDNATYADPYRASGGIVHVLVGGQLAVSDGELQSDVYAGRRVMR